MDVAVCIGKHCSKRPESPTLAMMLGASCDPVLVRCMGVCDGPVLAVTDGEGPDDVLILRRVRTPKDRRALQRLIGEGLTSKRIGKRTVTGKERRKAVDRVGRSLARRRRPLTLDAVNSPKRPGAG